MDPQLLLYKICAVYGYRQNFRSGYKRPIKYQWHFDFLLCGFTAFITVTCLSTFEKRGTLGISNNWADHQRPKVFLMLLQNNRLLVFPKNVVLFQRVSYSRRSRNHYDVLGLSRNATDDEIRDAFVRQTKELHPDSQGPVTSSESTSTYRASTTRFTEVKQAYDVLKNPEKRKEYDATIVAESVRRPKGHLQESDHVPDGLRHFVRNTPGPSVSRFGHFYNPAEAMQQEERSNRSMHYMGGVVVCIIVLNFGFVRYLQWKHKKALPSDARPIHATSTLG